MTSSGSVLETAGDVAAGAAAAGLLFAAIAQERAAARRRASGSSAHVTGHVSGACQSRGNGQLLHRRPRWVPLAMRDIRRDTGLGLGPCHRCTRTAAANSLGMQARYR